MAPRKPAQKPETEVAGEPVTSAPADAAPADAAPADAAPADAAPADAAEEEPGDVLEVVMNIAISGTRNGDAWPPAGGSITLPAAEAQGYIDLGYCRLA